MRNIAIRDAYGEALAKLGAVDKRVIVLESDVGNSTKSCIFGNKYPNRYFNVGIAELNMTTMAAGFAYSGFIPFVNTFSVFLATRSADPIQSLICYDNLNVKLAGAYSGLSDSYDGASHQSLTDIAYLRAIPNLTLISVCDAIETEKAVFKAVKHNGPVYLRLSRASMPNIFEDSYDFQIGKGVLLKEGKEITIVATGYMVHKALEAAKLLDAIDINATVLNIHTIKPIDRDLLIACAKRTGAIVTVEEHSIFGGLGGAVAEVLATEYPVPIGFLGISDFTESGDYEQLLSKYSLDSKAILQKCKEIISKK